MVSRIFLILFLSYANAEAHLKWFDEHDEKEAFLRAWSAMDTNGDFHVTIDELRNGILSQADVLTGAKVFEQYHSFIPESFTCTPQLDAIHFIDCWVIASRQTSVPDNTHISFKKAIREYFGECSDMSPSDDVQCNELVEQSPQLCLFVGEQTCAVSCYKCNEPTILGAHVRGTNKRFFKSPSASSLEYTLRMQSNRNSSLVPDLSVPSNDMCTPVKGKRKGGSIFWVSDWHTEPWYDVNGPNRVARFAHADGTNMWECRNKSKIVDCTMTGHSDPPLQQFESVMDYIKLYKTVSTPLLFFVGDADAHRYSYDSNINQSLARSVARMLNKTLPLILAISPPSHIVYTAGNHDASHNAIFTPQGDPKADAAYAQALIHNGIVTNSLQRQYKLNGTSLNQTEFFSKTGYYMKVLPYKQDYFAIILNTNLGASNGIQNAAMNADLKWIQGRGGRVVVFGHHPDVTIHIVPSPFKSIVSGTFSGHIHRFEPTDSNGFTVCPPVTEGADYTAFLTGDFGKDGKLVLTAANMITYKGAKNKVPSAQCWL